MFFEESGKINPWYYGSMKIVPYEKNRGSSCALSCYTMAARYLWPEKDITFDKLAEIAGYVNGYCVWGFPVWRWMIEQGAEIVDIDVIDYEAWAKEGLEGFMKSVSPKNFEWFASHSFDIEKDTKNLQKLFGNPRFSFVKKVANWDDVVREFAKPGICDVTIDARVLNGAEGYSLHRVLLLDITDNEVVFHDPDIEDTGANRRAKLESFRKAFLAVPDGAEICRYSLREDN